MDRGTAAVGVVAVPPPFPLPVVLRPGVLPPPPVDGEPPDEPPDEPPWLGGTMGLRGATGAPGVTGVAGLGTAGGVMMGFPPPPLPLPPVPPLPPPLLPPLPLPLLPSPPPREGELPRSNSPARFDGWSGDALATPAAPAAREMAAADTSSRFRGVREITPRI
jgi:hypothetical protein